MKSIQVGTSEVILQNYDINQGKIIISDLYNGSYSYYWGSMSGTLEEFLRRIDSGYFANALAVERYVYSGEATAKNIRKYIREELSSDLPWYKYTEMQKELRQYIKDIEKCDSQDHAIQLIGNLHSSIYYWDMSLDEEREIYKLLEDHFACEPWHFLETKPSPQYKFLVNLHKELIKQL